MSFARLLAPVGGRLAAVLLASLAAACSSPEPFAPVPAAPGVDPPAGVDPPPRKELDVERYAVTGEFDWSRRRLVATVAITLLPGDDGVRSIHLDSGVDVSAVRLAGGASLPYTADAGSRALRIDVSRVPGIAPDEAITLEIDYEAAEGDALRPIPARQGDPAASRVVYTVSEPLEAALWLPCHNTPEDRAIFSIDMRMDERETMIANGALVSDTEDTSGRRMKYTTDYTVPTYLMAFAIGELEVEQTMKGSLPVSVWHRAGVRGDYDRLLEELVRAIDAFEGLLGPYPFEKYALVLLPEFPGGLENLGISFQVEERSTAPTSSDDLLLTMHELGHQWFGDLVTVRSWDDLWIKEGMATLLEHEGARVYLDESQAGTLNGDYFQTASGDAIRDPERPPAFKYTSGPYGRAAWLLTQIRSLVGEEIFWGTLRGVLEDHRFGAIGTDELIDALADALGPDATARVKRAILAKELPRLEVAPSPSGGALVTLRDPEGALVAPIDLLWIADDGATRTQVLELDQEIEVAPQRDGELLIVDPLDRHIDVVHLVRGEPNWTHYTTHVAPLRRPARPSQIARFLQAGGPHQRAALREQGLPDMTPDGLESFVEALDSEDAKGAAVAAACAAAAEPAMDPALRAAWSDVISRLLAGPRYAPWTEFQPRQFDACDEVVDVLALYASEWSALEAGVPPADLSDAHLRFLAGFDLPIDKTLSVWGNVARRSDSLRARAIATNKVHGEVFGAEPEGLAGLRAFFVEMVASTDVPELFLRALGGVRLTKAPTAAENAEALAALSQVLRAPTASSFHEAAACAAFELAQRDSKAWSELVAGLAGVELSEHVAALLADPAAFC